MEKKQISFNKFYKFFNILSMSLIIISISLLLFKGLNYGVDFKDINVLEDPMIRVKLTEYSNWPTIPQLFVKGELIGGADIALELHQKGQLLDILDKTV